MSKLAPPLPLARCSVEAPDGRHFCQIHHDERSLVQAIAAFALSGWRAGESVFLIAPEERLRNVYRRLEKAGHDVASLVESGHLVPTTVCEMRASCSENGVFDREKLRESFKALFARRDGGERFRVYGEVSNSFWHEGDVETAVVLDEICNECLEGREIALFCGYLFDALRPESYRSELERICRAHHFIPETPEDGRLRIAVDKASDKVLGIPLSVSLNRIPARDAWLSRLPLARRTLLWLQENMPSSMLRVMACARDYYR